MIFKFFRRAPAPVVKPKPRRRPSKGSSSHDALTEPATLPEVREGSEQSDWALWENSVAALDSQMQSLGPNSRYSRLVEDETPTEFQEVDAYATVKRKDS